jgi:hypothetical protein
LRDSNKQLHEGDDVLFHAEIISVFQAEVKLEKELDSGVDLVYYVLASLVQAE